MMLNIDLAWGGLLHALYPFGHIQHSQLPTVGGTNGIQLGHEQDT